MTSVEQIVRDVRVRRNVTVEQLATQTRVPLKDLQAFEEGIPALSTAQLARIAAALELTFSSLIHGEMVEAPAASVFFRHGSFTDFSADDEPVLAQALTDAAQLLALREKLQKPRSLRRTKLFTPRAASATTSTDTARDGYQLARHVRNRLSQRGSLSSPDGPLPDLRALLEDSFEILVVVRRLRSSRTSAVLASAHPSDACAVILNEADPDRKNNPWLDRVHLAHELCHALFDPNENGQLHLVVETDSQSRDESNERRAKAFAAEFLLPKEGLAKLIGKKPITTIDDALRSLQRVREHFGTPWEIAAYHLCNHHHYDETLRDALLDRKGKAKGSPPERLPAPGAVSVTVRSLVEEAHRESLITDGQARTALRLSLVDALPWSDT